MFFMQTKFFSATLLALGFLTFGAGCVNSGSVSSTTNSTEAVAVDSSTPKTMSTTNQTWTFPGKLPDEKISNKQVRIVTAKGVIVFELLPEVAPLTVSNFVYLTEAGYYDGLNFHRRVDGFVLQGGDPLGNGSGGPGYSIPAEFNNVKHDRGIVAMARSQDPDSAGSQFYFTLAPAYFLDNNYTVFGRVLEGLEVIDQLQEGDVMNTVIIETKE